MRVDVLKLKSAGHPWAVMLLIRYLKSSTQLRTISYYTYLSIYPASQKSF
jgi:hypothetical protein